MVDFGMCGCCCSLVVFLMKFYLNITMSKIVAVLIIVLAFVLDAKQWTGGSNFMFALPFVTGIVTGKQYFDSKELEKK
jgi:hypothetical protein